MHEYAITKELLRVARETAEKNNIKEVAQVIIEIGNESGYVADSIVYYFETLRESRDRLHNATLICKEILGPKINIKSIKGD